MDEENKKPVKVSGTKESAAKPTATKSTTAKSTAAKSTTAKSTAAKPTATKSTAAKSTAAKATTTKSTAEKTVTAKEAVETAATVDENILTETVKADEQIVETLDVSTATDENNLTETVKADEQTVETLDVSTAADEIPEDEESLNDKVKILSPGKLVLKRFFRSKLSMIGLITIIVLFLFSFLGPVFSPWGEIQVDDTLGKTNVLSTAITFEGADGETYTIYEVTSDTLKQNIYAPPSKEHWLGTDDKGMDVLTRLMYGGRISLSLGFIVILLEVIVGVIMGGLAGFFGKWVDQLIMRIVDIFSCLPTLPILLIASALIDAWGVGLEYRIYYLMVILTFFGWAGIARLVRGQILSLREQEFMVAAEATGLSSMRKIFKHLIPNVMPQLIVTMTLGLGGIILYESTLSYLGLGVPYPYAAWGTMISGAQNPIILENYLNLWGPPGICIVLAVLAFNFVGDGLRDAFDPKMKR